jgi:hypothetical protein
MKRSVTIFLISAVLFILSMVSVSFGQAPPPPSHSQNGNQASPGGTGCPIDRSDGITIALVVSLGYAGYFLYRRGKKNEEIQ